MNLNPSMFLFLNIYIFYLSFIFVCGVWCVVCMCACVVCMCVYMRVGVFVCVMYVCVVCGVCVMCVICVMCVYMSV